MVLSQQGSTWPLSVPYHCIYPSFLDPKLWEKEQENWTSLWSVCFFIKAMYFLVEENTLIRGSWQTSFHLFISSAVLLLCVVIWLVPLSLTVSLSLNTSRKFTSTGKHASSLATSQIFERDQKTLLLFLSLIFPLFLNSHMRWSNLKAQLSLGNRYSVYPR